MKRRDFLSGAAVGAYAQARPDLLAIAAEHVRISEADRVRGGLWGRIGWSESERASARLLAAQLGRYLPQAKLEEFRFRAYRPASWDVRADGGTLASAMPAPFDAHFPEDPIRAPVVEVKADGDWSAARGRWALLRNAGFTVSTLVREKLLYQKAVESGAAGLVFSLNTPPDSLWRAVVPVDKPYAVRDERYPDQRRPIPCFAVDASDGSRIGGELTARIGYEKETRRQALNAVGYLAGHGERTVAILTHIDAFFSGACDNATGIATLVGLAHRLSRLEKAARRAHFWFGGLAAHHDSAEGMRAFLAKDDKRSASIHEMILLEHLDALDLDDGAKAGWPVPLNNQRTAYVGQPAWGEAKAVAARLARETGLMTADPEIREACIADLFVTCGKVRSFCLMQAPPFYHTDHDTLDRISRRGIEAGVEFHMRLLGATGTLELR